MESSTTFEPKGKFEYLDAHLEQVPRYLIRTTSPGSQGINDKTYIGSAAARANLNQDDLFSREFSAMKLMVERHLRWDESFKGDNLVSWSSSLLFVLYHAMQRQARDPGPTAFKDVLIMVLDTRKLPRGTFIATQVLLEAFNIESVDECRYEFCQMEYFTQGTLDLSKVYSNGGLVHMTLEDIIRLGLFELHPPFRERHFYQQLSLRCLEHRELFQRRPLAATQSEINIAERIAAGACTLPSFRPVVMIMLLSLWPRCRNDNAILQAFRKNKMGAIISKDTLEDYRAISTAVPEYRQFVLTMHDVHANAQRYSLKRVIPQLTKEKYFLAGFIIMLVEHGHLFWTTMLVLFTSLQNSIRLIYLPALTDFEVS